MSVGPYTGEPSNKTGNKPYVMVGRDQTQRPQPNKPMELTSEQRKTLQAHLGPRYDADRYAQQMGGYDAAMEDFAPAAKPAKKKAAKKKTKKKASKK